MSCSLTHLLNTHSLTHSLTILLEQGRPDEAAALLEEARARYPSSSAGPIHGLDTGASRNNAGEGSSYLLSSSREAGSGSFPFVDETTTAASYFGRSSRRASRGAPATTGAPGWHPCENRDNEPASARVSCSSSVADEASLVLFRAPSSPWRSCEEWSSYDETEQDGTEPPTPYGTEPPTPYRTEPPTQSGPARPNIAPAARG
jgi:hypothetical protein